jgi:phosphonate transport system permease protein
VAGILAAVAAIAGALAMLAAPLSAVLTPAGAARLARFLHGAFPPDLSRAFLGQVGVATLETLAIALLGTALGLVIGGALAYMATHNLFLHQLGDGRVPPARRAAYMAARWSLDVLRALPEVPLAVFLILAVGLGPFAGTLALGLHTAGVLGRLIADTLEAAERQAFLAVRAAGAGPLVATLYTAVPASASVLVAHTIYRWEMNVRASAVLGVVGAGGLGQALYTNLQLGFYDRLVTLLMVLFVLVTLGDRLGTLLRASWRRP